MGREVCLNHRFRTETPVERYTAPVPGHPDSESKKHLPDACLFLLCCLPEHGSQEMPRSLQLPTSMPPGPASASSPFGTYIGVLGDRAGHCRYKLKVGRKLESQFEKDQKARAEARRQAAIAKVQHPRPAASPLAALRKCGRPPPFPSSPRCLSPYPSRATGRGRAKCGRS
jgi:hypothetical protein